MKFIALGANLDSRFGTPVETLAAARAAVALAGMSVTGASRIWKTAPVPADQPWYYNQILSIDTDLSPRDLLAQLLAIEEDFGRVRTHKNAPRVLDLDLLAYDDVVLREDDYCIVPHPRMHERSFVLLPLRDIAPHWVHPVVGKTVVELLSGIEYSGADALALPCSQHRFATHASSDDGAAFHVMGIVNVTPDSFSDGGLCFSTEDAVGQALSMVQAGATILDIGGESTRPDAQPVSPEQEQDRILPVIERLVRLVKGRDVMVSVDTRHAATMRAAIAAGAGMVNDVSALSDPEAIGVLTAHPEVFACVMHMQGTPQTMQKEPHYDDVVEDVLAFLWGRLEQAQNAGIGHHRLIADVGIGFGKTLAHNLTLLAHIGRFHDLGVPLLLGTSRKRFIAGVDESAQSPSDRLGGSLASVLHGAEKGVQIMRVHDVPQTVQALKLRQAIQGAV